ncbi:uncharacterized protein K460DRAFT_188677 [Cucurbitaria berberidis CBS 394.84]|uniref:Heterokaryon incompatibility domain-containing protein n=1 Tax=Cucurbitaria berberidis CBS 394.84 TaxID=1168544 RepID=A0A9P4L5S8_9PLEO|nr:uncharacterized protein K460DRAFT_188677 [Cucurbitaria berberidis CBS 394.84]KAF1842584.1 hypothetical protein K460DRAFT_188677 [Cucurbitaria berberidis CBS 394.84]
MDRIYHGADFTIVATGPDKNHGLPGVVSARELGPQVFHLNGKSIVFTGPDPLWSIRDCTWMTTAWTFQEGYLSKRLLVFTDHQMSFYCGAASWMESLGGLEQFKDPGSINWNTWDARCSPYGIPESSTHPLSTSSRTGSTPEILRFRYNNFMDLATQYTNRGLRYDSDAINGFSGVMHFLEKEAPPILNVIGLPYIHWDTQRQKRFILSLCWYHSVSPEVTRRRAAFPSWSWADWTAGINWHTRNPLWNLDIMESSVRNVSLESRDPSRSIISIDSQPSQEFLATVTTIHLEALIFPAHLLSARSAESIWTTDSWDDIIVHEDFETLTAMAQPTWSPSHFRRSLEEGIWSCLMLELDLVFPSRPGFLIVVEWKDNETAVRVGGLLIDIYSNDPWPPMEYRKVRLV